MQKNAACKNAPLCHGGACGQKALRPRLTQSRTEVQYLLKNSKKHGAACFIKKLAVQNVQIKTRIIGRFY
jgi:hypothetical protein